MLVGVTAVWGWTFLSFKNAVLNIPVMDFLAIRFTIAAVLLGGEAMTVRNLTGGVCIVVAMLVVQLASRAKPLTFLEP